MTDLQERKDTKAAAATASAAGFVPVAQPTEAALPKVVLNNYQRPQSVLLSDDAVKQVRQASTDANLKSNFWFETASILRWVTTFSLGGAALIVGKVLGIGTAAVSIGSVAVPLALTLGIAAIAATALIAASTHSRKVFIERTFDVQDFQMQRQATLVGKSVENAVTKKADSVEPANWSDKFAPRNANENWSQAVQADKAASLEAVRA